MRNTSHYSFISANLHIWQRRMANKTADGHNLFIRREIHERCFNLQISNTETELLFISQDFSLSYYRYNIVVCKQHHHFKFGLVTIGTLKRNDWCTHSTRQDIRNNDQILFLTILFWNTTSAWFFAAMS